MPVDQDRHNQAAVQIDLRLYRDIGIVPYFMGEMAGEARFSREMAAARGLIGDPAQARRDSPDPGRRHDGRGHLAAIFGRRAGRAAAE